MSKGLVRIVDTVFTILREKRESLSSKRKEKEKGT